MLIIHLFLVPENKDLFDTIDDSLLVLCLDDNYKSSDGTSTKKDNQTLAALSFLHGGGTKNNTANRWFDKTLQVNSIHSLTKTLNSLFSLS
jgi:hypothetical protein